MSATTATLGLLDTSAVLLRGQVVDVEVLPEIGCISTITIAELSVGPLLVDDPVEQARRQGHLQQAESDFDAIPFDATAARAYASVARAMHDRGRSVRPRRFDALIAAVALANGLPLHTANPRDFEGIPGLKVVDIGPGLAPTP